MSWRSLLAASVGLSMLPGAGACPLQAADGWRVAGEGVALAWRVHDDGPADAAPPLATPFALHVRLCPPQAELLAVDATMPAHRHGMNYRPSLQALGGGRWRVDGLLWHMPGTWALRLEVRLDGRAQVLQQRVDLQ